MAETSGAQPVQPPGPMPGRCGARTRKGGFCTKHPINGRKRCRKHGGKTPVGPASPHWKHGGYSKHMPKALLAGYQAAASDRALGSLKTEMALVVSRVGQLLGNLGRTGNLALWRQADERLRAFQKITDDPKRAETALGELRETITAGLKDESTWAEIYEVVDLKRRLSEAEAKRLKDLHQMLTVQQALALMTQLVQAVISSTAPAEVKRAIVEEFRRLTAGRDPEAADGGPAG